MMGTEEKKETDFVDPEKFLRDLNVLAPGMRVADFGSGAGYFAVPLARIVGAQGTVWAIDIRASALNLVESRAKHEGLFHIRYVRSDLEEPRGSTIKDGGVDAVFAACILYQAQKKHAILEEAARILRKAGTLLLLEWRVDATTMGPPKEQRVAPETVKQLAKEVGFRFVKEFGAGAFHYGLLFEK